MNFVILSFFVVFVGPMTGFASTCGDEVKPPVPRDRALEVLATLAEAHEGRHGIVGSRDRASDRFNRAVAEASADMRTVVQAVFTPEAPTFWADLAALAWFFSETTSQRVTPDVGNHFLRMAQPAFVTAFTAAKRAYVETSWGAEALARVDSSPSTFSEPGTPWAPVDTAILRALMTCPDGDWRRWLNAAPIARETVIVALEWREIPRLADSIDGILALLIEHPLIEDHRAHYVSWAEIGLRKSSRKTLRLRALELVRRHQLVSSQLTDHISEFMKESSDKDLVIAALRAHSAVTQDLDETLADAQWERAYQRMGTDLHRLEILHAWVELLPLSQRAEAHLIDFDDGTQGVRARAYDVYRLIQRLRTQDVPANSGA